MKKKPVRWVAGGGWKRLICKLKINISQVYLNHKINIILFEFRS